VDFTSRVPDPDHDSESVQTFLSTTEGAFQTHPLFANATDEELESAGEVSFINLFVFSSSIVHHFLKKNCGRMLVANLQVPVYLSYPGILLLHVVWCSYLSWLDLTRPTSTGHAQPLHLDLAKQEG
jgi:hypothetical protein